MIDNVFAVQCKSLNKFPFNIFALLIMHVSKTKYSHYALKFVSDSGEVTYYDSTASGVQGRSEHEFLKKYQIISSVPIDYLGADNFNNWFSRHNKKGYGFIQIIGLLGKICKVIVNNPFGLGAKRIICNELVILYTNYRGITNIKDTDSLDLNDTEKIIKEISDV